MHDLARLLRPVAPGPFEDDPLSLGQVDAVQGQLGAYGELVLVVHKVVGVGRNGSHAGHHIGFDAVEVRRGRVGAKIDGHEVAVKAFGLTHKAEDVLVLVKVVE